MMLYLVRLSHDNYIDSQEGILASFYIDPNPRRVRHSHDHDIDSQAEVVHHKMTGDWEL